MFIAALYVNNLNVVTWLKKLRYRYIIEWFPRWFSGKESVCNSGNVSSVSGFEDPLEKEMAAHSSILAWRIPRTEELGRLQFTGSQSQTQLSDQTPPP